MNFLAHLFLSGSHEHLIVGNFLADYLKNRDVAALPRPIQEGVRMHRKIDSFTDEHPAVRSSVKLLRPHHHKFAPVVSDICFDFVLAKNWIRYTDVPLRDFTAGVYEVLAKNISLMPPLLQERLPRMIASDWLVAYGTEEGLRFTFSRMQLRTKYPRFFDYAVDHFLADYQLHEQNFNLFFPDLIAVVKDWHLRSE